MRRMQKEICQFCGNATVDAGAPFCSDCGHPTLFATHTQRVEWEVRQWRKARTGPSSTEVPLAVSGSKQGPTEIGGNGRAGTVATLDRRDATADESRSPSSLGMLLKRFVHWLREAFGTPVWSETIRESNDSTTAIPNQSTAPVRPKAPVLVEQDRQMPVEASAAVDAEENAEQPVPPSAAKPSDLRLAARATLAPRKPLLADPTPIVASEDLPSVPAKPQKAKAARKRSKVPTNKEMLKRTLSVLTRVERRLLHLEEEFAGGDAARRSSSTAANGTLNNAGSSSGAEMVDEDSTKPSPLETRTVTWIGPVRIEPTDQSDRSDAKPEEEHDPTA